MRVVHIGDPHLGYRAYNRVNAAGVNAREADVFAAFREAFQKTVEINPELVLIAGDLFHVVRPSNLTIQHTFRELLDFRSKCAAPVIVIGGNHDSPRSADVGCILDLFLNIPGIHVAHSEYAQIYLKNLNTSVFCLCHRALPQISSLKIAPDPDSRYNILLAHGTVEGVARGAYDIFEISRADVISDAWDYIAFGHYHIFQQIAPNACYAGSLEYTSTNIWSETAQPKGFVEYDLDERRLVRFHQVNTRDVIDLAPVDAAELQAADINRIIQERVDAIPGGFKNKVVRLVVNNIDRSVQADLDFAMVRSVRAEALHFELQLRPPGRGTANATVGERSGRTLEEEWAEFARVCDLPAGVDRDRLSHLGREYLAGAGEAVQ